jgi:hypothetical protein
MPAQHEVHTEDVDLEGVPREVERTMKDRRILLDGRRKKAGAER